MLFDTCIVLVTLVGAVYCVDVPLSSQISSANPTTISCDAALNSYDTLSWKYRNSSGVTIDLPATTLSINLTSLDEVGFYTCRINESDIYNISAVYLDKPVFKTVKHSVTFNNGDKNHKLECLSGGSYPPVDFQWKRRLEDADEYETLNPALHLNINITENTERSTLFFLNLTYDMQAHYECYVANSAGNSTVDVLVRVKDRLAALWPFLGIVAEVIVLIVIIFAYEKRSRKSAQVTANNIKDELEKPLHTNSGNGGELRNRAPNNNYK